MQMNTHFSQLGILPKPLKFAGYYRQKVEGSIQLGSYEKDDGTQQDVWVTSQEQRQLLGINRKLKRNNDVLELDASHDWNKKLTKEKQSMLAEARRQFDAVDRKKSQVAQSQAPVPAVKPKTFFEYVADMIEAGQAPPNA